MGIDRFCYEWQYILFPVDPMDLKLTECTHGGVVNIHIKFEVIWTKLRFMLISGFLANLWHYKFYGSEMVKIYSINYFGSEIYTINKKNDTLVM